jgi:hypothetical protein
MLEVLLFQQSPFIHLRANMKSIVILISGRGNLDAIIDAELPLEARAPFQIVTL